MGGVGGVGWGGVGWGMLTFLLLARMVDATQCTCLSEPCTHGGCYAVHVSFGACTHGGCYAMHLPSEISAKNRNTRGVNARLLEYVHSFQFRFNNKLWKSTGKPAKKGENSGRRPTLWPRHVFEML